MSQIVGRSRQASEPPSYARRSSRILVEHVKSPQQRSDLLLKFRSYASRPDSTPIFLGPARPITGVVEVTMKKKTSLKAITVKVRGYLRRTLKKQDDAANRKIFAEVSHELWPNKSSPGTTTLGPGVHTWDFSLLLPTSFSSDKGTLHTLPPSFSHPKFRDHVVYEMSLLLEKGGLFSFNEGFTFPVRYFLRTYARPCATEIQLARTLSVPLPSPSQSPSAWITTHTTIRGRLFFQREVTFSVEFSVPQPGEYSRAGSLNSYLLVRSADSQALDLIASCNSCEVVLRRYIDQRNEATSTSPRTRKSTLQEIVACGKLWLVFESGDTRAFYGEVNFPPQLDADFAIPSLSLTHSADLRITATGFVPSAPDVVDDLWASLPVIITTDQGRPPGPAPVYSEEYVPPRRSFQSL